MDATITASLTGLPLASAMKVAHSVLDSLNRRRAPSRDVLVNVDGPEEVDRVTQVATGILQRIERDEGRPLADLPNDLVRQYAEVVLAAANDRARSDLPVVDESRGRVLLDDLQNASVSAR
jgi:hypothetical protein